jgi:hypothetical protein
VEIRKHVCREEGPTTGTSIRLTGGEVCLAIEAWLVAHGVRIQGPRTITVNRNLCKSGHIYVDPSGYVIVPAEHSACPEKGDHDCSYR